MNLKNFKVDYSSGDMKAFAKVIHYIEMVEKETGNEVFIIAMDMSASSSVGQYRTYSVSENGIITKINFPLESKSKLEIQWIKGLASEERGYYMDLRCQKSGTVSLLALTILRLVSLLGGVRFRRKALLQEHSEAT